MATVERIVAARIDDVQQPADECEEVERVRLVERDARVPHEIGLGLVVLFEPAGTPGTEARWASALRRDPPALAMPALLRHPGSLSEGGGPAPRLSHAPAGAMTEV